MIKIPYCYRTKHGDKIYCYKNKPDFESGDLVI